MAKMFIVKRFPRRKSDFNNHRISKLNVFRHQNLEEIQIKGESYAEKIKVEEPQKEEIIENITPIEEVQVEEIKTEEAPIEEAKVEEIKTEEAPIEEENLVEDKKLEKKTKKTKTENKKKKKNKDMITENQIANAEEQAENLVSNTVKVVKKDRGLIERAESSKIILTEDNRQVLND